jgi:hypothetical protein
MIATVWYPPESWRPGEIVATGTLPWDVGSDFGVGLGVVQGDDWSDASRRLPIRVESSDLVMRLLEGDTWARLLQVREGVPAAERRIFAPPSPQHPLDADFGGQVRLLGYDLDCEEGSTSCQVRLYWQAQERLDTSYTVFAQLLGPAGRVRAQVDTVPGAGGYPTNWWLAGEIVADSLTLTLPPDAPQNTDYRLIVGLYEATSGARLPVANTGADFVELATIRP